MNLTALKGSTYDLNDEDILTNDVTFPHEYNPNHTRLWIIGHEYGAIVALWANNESDAFDEMLDRGYEHFLVEEPEEDPDSELYTYLGNASEPCNLTYAWTEEVRLDPATDWKLMLKLAEARGAGADHL